MPAAWAMPSGRKMRPALSTLTCTDSLPMNRFRTTLFGSLLSTPIITPPQTGILGLHAIQDRPVVVDGQMMIRPMMYLALTYDHRLVDGREAVGFLRRIKEILEDPARMLLEI